MAGLYGFEYFCGANVLIKIEGMTIMEAAGISYEISESKRPLYGYSSRHFDAVASGQVLVQGTLLINYVHEDYLYRAIGIGLDEGIYSNPSSTDMGGQGQLSDSAFNASREFAEAGLTSAATDFANATAFIDAMKSRYWRANDVGDSARPLHDTQNPHDIRGGLDIKIVFGEQDENFKAHGRTGVLLSGVHFTGRSKVIRIDEDVIVEAYSFIARKEQSLRKPYRPVQVTAGNEVDPKYIIQYDNK